MVVLRFSSSPPRSSPEGRAFSPLACSVVPAAMVSTQQVVKTVLGMVGTMGLGIALWAVITPSEEQIKLRAKELPRSSPEHQTEQRRLNAAVMAVIKEAAETNENVARRPWYPVKGSSG